MAEKCSAKAKMAARMDDSAGPVTNKPRRKTPKGNPVKAGGKVFGSKRQMRSVKSA